MTMDGGQAGAPRPESGRDWLGAATAQTTPRAARGWSATYGSVAAQYVRPCLDWRPPPRPALPRPGPATARSISETEPTNVVFPTPNPPAMTIAQRGLDARGGCRARHRGQRPLPLRRVPRRAARPHGGHRDGRLRLHPQTQTGLAVGAGAAGRGHQIALRFAAVAARRAGLPILAGAEHVELVRSISIGDRAARTLTAELARHAGPKSALLVGAEADSLVLTQALDALMPGDRLTVVAADNVVTTQIDRPTRRECAASRRRIDGRRGSGRPRG